MSIVQPDKHANHVMTLTNIFYSRLKAISPNIISTKSPASTAVHAGIRNQCVAPLEGVYKSLPLKW